MVFPIQPAPGIWHPAPGTRPPASASGNPRLAPGAGLAYAYDVIGFLRIVGVLNVAIWFGASVAFTFVFGRAVFSQDMRQVLGEPHFPYYSGAIATVLISRFFDLQMICGLIALLHLAAEWTYLSRPLPRLWQLLLTLTCAFILFGAFVAQPKIQRYHRVKYNLRVSPDERASAAAWLKFWHGSSQGVNLIVLVILGCYYWRVVDMPVAGRLASPLKLGG